MWLFWSAASGLRISSLPEQVIDILDLPRYPVDVTWWTSENYLALLQRRVLNIPEVWIDGEIVENFLDEREKLIEKTDKIWQKLLESLWIEHNDGNRILIHSRLPQYNSDDPQKILNRWGYSDMTWNDFFKWEGKHRIEWSYNLEDWIQFLCNDEGVEASWSVTLKFSPNGLMKLVLHMKKKTWTLISTSTEGVEVMVKNIDEIRRQIFQWKNRDWSQDIIREHERVRERWREGINEYNRDKREKRNLNLLKWTTFLTPPKETFQIRRDIQKILT